MLNEIMESFKLFNRCSKEGESVLESIVKIRRIADNCNFPMKHALSYEGKEEVLEICQVDK